MVTTEIIKVNGKDVECTHVASPGGEGHPNMLIMTCAKGFIMCGYLNMEASVAFDDVSCIISGKNFQDLLANPVKAVSPAAEKLGIKVGMTGEEACVILS